MKMMIEPAHAGCHEKVAANRCIKFVGFFCGSERQFAPIKNSVSRFAMAAGD
jgi:hypothetical protein